MNVKLVIEYVKNGAQGKVEEFHTNRYAAEQSALSMSKHYDTVVSVCIVPVVKHIELVSQPQSTQKHYTEVK